MLNLMVKHAPDLSDVFAALADPTRRRLLELLATGERCVTELAKPFRMSLAAVSKHLQVLERAGLLDRRREGRTHHLSAKPEALSQARAWIEQYAQAWEQSFDALDALLAEQHAPPSSPNPPPHDA